MFLLQYSTYFQLLFTHLQPMHFSSGFLLVIIVARWHQMARFIFVIMGSVKGLLCNGHQAIPGTNSYHM